MKIDYTVRVVHPLLFVVFVVVATPGAGGGARMGIVFDPPPWDELVHGFGQAIVLGIMGGMIPKWTKERIREKEAGLEVDELYEMGLDGDGGDEDEYGYGAGYVCGTCDNTNEVCVFVCGCFGLFRVCLVEQGSLFMITGSHFFFV